MKTSLRQPLGVVGGGGGVDDGVLGGLPVD